MAFVVAIDGPAASGKGTLARRLADEYGFHHLDTGLTYRAVAKALLDAHLPLDDEAQAAAIAEELDLSHLDRAVLSSHAIGEAASKVAVMSAVRVALVAAQRRFAQRLPGAVIDGRDAHLLDTSEMDIEAAFRAAKTLIDIQIAVRN